jgi:hypothetical protein
VYYAGGPEVRAALFERLAKQAGAPASLEATVAARLTTAAGLPRYRTIVGE